MTASHELKTNYLSIFAVVLFSGCMPLPEAHAAVSGAEISSKISQAKILPKGEKISVLVNGLSVEVSKRIPVDSTNLDSDCKIESILISHEIMLADKEIRKVKVRFLDPHKSKCYEVLVREGDIKAFATGAISQADLLASLDLVPLNDANLNDFPAPDANASTSPGTTGDAASSKEPKPDLNSVAAGPKQAERAILQSKIRGLSANGINTKAYEDQFALLESSAKKNDAASVEPLLDKLNLSVQDQQKSLAQRGKPIRKILVQGHESFGEGPGEEPGGYKNRRELAMGEIRNMFGPMTPLPGMFFQERVYITKKIKGLIHSGGNEKSLESVCLEMNRMTRASENAALRTYMDTAYKMLKIPRFDAEHRQSPGD